ncbi:hypothetical protein EVAR_20109_1 [Eumeta japonica]|uniref:Uncharacterized protein n=1 Tax=Eumeta variegata TaxID=151549 RepID=A0A4C1V3U0_EUMVA|nr:hypothetical protein EVAR_20109_1 [Eumeta japonica]
MKGDNFSGRFEENGGQVYCLSGMYCCGGRGRRVRAAGGRGGALPEHPEYLASEMRFLWAVSFGRGQLIDVPRGGARDSITPPPLPC